MVRKKKFVTTQSIVLLVTPVVRGGKVAYIPICLDMMSATEAPMRANSIMKG